MSHLTKKTKSLISDQSLNERGSLAIELAVIAPILIVGFMLLIVYAGRVTQVQNDLKSAAHSAARAASIRPNEAGAFNAVLANVESNLVFSDLNCQNSASSQVDVVWEETPNDDVGLRLVTVRLICRVSLSDFVLLGVPGARTFEVTASEVIDRYRA